MALAEGQSLRKVSSGQSSSVPTAGGHLQRPGSPPAANLSSRVQQERVVRAWRFFGQHIDCRRTEAARAVNYLVSADAGMMTGTVINFDQSVWGAYPFAPPTPEGKMKLG